MRGLLLEDLCTCRLISYVTRILVDTIWKNVIPSIDEDVATKDATGKEDDDKDQTIALEEDTMVKEDAMLVEMGTQEEGAAKEEGAAREEDVRVGYKRRT